MQKFTKYLESDMQDCCPDDIPISRIVCLRQYLDNASHFKRTGAIHYFTTRINNQGELDSTAFVYSFGALGHQEGPYNGIGGQWKNKCDQTMSTAEKPPLDFTKPH